MTTQSALATVTLKRHNDKRVKNGHLWVFSNEIYTIDGAPEAGEVVRVLDGNRNLLGVGYYNPNSLIAVRMLQSHEAPIDMEFYRNRIAVALELRQRFYPVAEAVRLVHGESDGLPGLLIDKIGEAVSIQIVSAGAEKHRSFILEAVRELVSPAYIIFRNDSGLRNLEGLEQSVEVALGADPLPPITFSEHGISYTTDVQHGQKTGFFIDQHENRLMFRRCVKAGDRVLDAFCNEGGFALNALAAGASEVVAADISEPALDHARQNAAQNGWADKITFIRTDLMKWLPDQAESETFDVVNLDPPGFAKNRKSAGAALRGYQKIHEAAMRMTKNGGFLATSTCSHHIDTDRFLDTVTMAAQRTGHRVMMVHRGSQPADHPVLPSMPETEYLRFFIFKVYKNKPL